MIGKEISHYKILEKLGEGGMGIVYKAEDTILKRSVALKFLKLQSISSEEDKARFLQEARTAAALDHPNIGAVFEINEIDDLNFIAMSYIEGQTLEEKLESGPLTVEEALNITLQIAQGLQVAHEKGIVHRDIKSANVMVTGDGNAKLMDFGIAHLEGGQNLTKAGTPLGTPSYMSPEQIKGECVDDKSDIFALGILFYEMLTGHLPFKGERKLAVMHSILYDNPFPPETFDVTLPRDVQSIIWKAIEKDSSKRYQSTTALLADLDDLNTTGGPERLSKTQRRKFFKVPRFAFPILFAVVFLAVVIFTVQHFFTNGLQQFDSNSIAVMYFNNHTNDSDLDWQRQGLAKVLSVYLERDTELHVADDENLAYYLQKANVDQSTAISLRTARKVARQLKVGTLVMGEFLGNKNAMIVNVKLYDVNDKSFIAGEQIDVLKYDELINFMESLSNKIKTHLQVAQLEIDEYEASKVSYTTSVEALKNYIVGRNLFSTSRFAESLDYFQAAIQADSAFIMPYLIASIAATATSQDSLARVIHNSLKPDMRKITPKERLMYDFSDAELNRDNQKLKKIVLELIDMEPKNAGWKLHLGVIYYRLDQPERAISPLEDALEIDPNFDQIYFILGWAYHETNQYDKAVKIYKAGLKIFPDYYWVLLPLAREYHRRERLKDEQKILDHLVSICEKGDTWPIFDCYYDLGRLYAAHDFTVRAIEFFTKAIQIDSTYAHTYFRLGRAYYAQKEWANAIANFQTCIDLDDGHTEAHYQLAGSFEKQGDIEQAIERYEQYLLRHSMGALSEGAKDKLEFLKGRL